MKKSIFTSFGILLGACALCCAGPILTLLGVGSLTGLVGALHSLEMGAVTLVSAILVFGVYRFYRSKQVASCKINCGCKST